MGHPASSQFGPFLIDVGERILRRDGEPVPLTPKAFDVLAALLEKPGQLITKDELLRKVWPEIFVEESNLAYNIFALRKALGDTADNSRYIETVPKKGYRFKAGVSPAIPSRSAHPASEFGAEPGYPRSLARPVMARSRSCHSARERPSLRSRWSGKPSHIVLLSNRWRCPTPLHDGASPSAGLGCGWPPRPFWSLQGSTSSSRSSRDGIPRRHAATCDSSDGTAGVVRSPSLSPDGTFVVFSWNGPRKDNPDLYVQQIGVTAPPYRLTTDPANDYSPSWSPDGRTIAFLRRGPDGGKSEVWRIAPLGGPERKVAEIQPRLASFRPASIAWCPDSTCLLVTDTLGAAKPDVLFQISLESGERRQLTHPRGLARDADPVISPDGGLLVFRRDATPGSGDSTGSS